MSQTENLLFAIADQPNVAILENHPQDSRVKIREDGTFQTLSGKMGTGGVTHR